MIGALEVCQRVTQRSSNTILPAGELILQRGRCYLSKMVVLFPRYRYSGNENKMDLTIATVRQLN